jgi:ankyrin repeat protein
MKTLLQHGADPNQRDQNGWTPLMKAVSLGSIDAVKILLEAGADRAIRDGKDRTAADVARAYQQHAILKILQDVRSP